MKSMAILVIGVLLGVGLMLFVPHGAPQVVYADPPSGNGDVNGSGAIDIADAIYLLTYLFAQGPEPEAIECAACDSCCPPPAGGALPATGQTACYDVAGNVIACDSAEYPGQDGFYQKGCPQEGRFVDNGDGTVTDNCTGLMWQKNTAPAMCTWQQALQNCKHLVFAGHDDWRLPNVCELESIVDCGRTNPSINPVFEAVPGGYWSSSTRVSDSIYAWIVFFKGDFIGSYGYKPQQYFVRAVRGGL